MQISIPIVFLSFQLETRARRWLIPPNLLGTRPHLPKVRTKSLIPILLRSWLFFALRFGSGSSSKALVKISSFQLLGSRQFVEIYPFRLLDCVISLIFLLPNTYLVLFGNESTNLLLRSNMFVQALVYKRTNFTHIFSPLILGPNSCFLTYAKIAMC